MEYFKDLRESRITRLTENKDRFIQKSTVLTDDQKKEVLDFFRSHANLENRIQNWNYNIPYETFKQVIDSVDTVDKRLKKQTKELKKQNGLEGLVEGEDYNLVAKEGSITIYQPLTHKASRVIASNMVEPKIWCKSSVMKWSPKEVLPEGEPMKDGFYPGAKWCISMETNSHWSDYTKRGDKFFIVCNPDARTEKRKKVCLTCNSRNEFDSLAYADDTSTRKVPEELTALINKYFEGLVTKKLKNLSNYLNKETGKYDYLNKVFTPRDLIKYGKFIVPIGIWEGDFDCAYTQLTSLEGAPRVVGGFFSCNNNQLTSLQGVPERVGGHFDCSNNKLTSLVDAPREVGGDFRCNSNQLTSLKGVPREVRGDFSCNNNQLTSLQGVPERVGGFFSCNNNQLTSLEGAPEKVGKGFYCSYNKLTSLEGAPKEVGGNFDCSRNNLTSLEGAPKEVRGDFDCSCNKLTSLEGVPEYVGGDFWCWNNPLTSLEGKPEYIGGKLYK